MKMLLEIIDCDVNSKKQARSKAHYFLAKSLLGSNAMRDRIIIHILHSFILNGLKMTNASNLILTGCKKDKDASKEEFLGDNYATLLDDIALACEL